MTLAATDVHVDVAPVLHQCKLTRRQPLPDEDRVLCDYVCCDCKQTNQVKLTPEEFVAMGENLPCTCRVN
jgi:hypothetical protein